jgi:hypothetical protein
VTAVINPQCKTCPHRVGHGDILPPGKAPGRKLRDVLDLFVAVLSDAGYATNREALEQALERRKQREVH